MSQNHRQRIGQWGETYAARYLEEKGYKIVARNSRTPYGEIDLVALLGDELVFVEVKTRTGTAFGAPEEAIDSRKLAHLTSAAQAYINSLPGQAVNHWRIDVISVQGRPGQETQVEHFENIAA